MLLLRKLKFSKPNAFCIYNELLKPLLRDTETYRDIHRGIDGQRYTKKKRKRGARRKGRGDRKGKGERGEDTQGQGVREQGRGERTETSSPLVNGERSFPLLRADNTPLYKALLC